VDTGDMKFACCDEMRRSHCNVDKNGNRSDFESDSSINNFNTNTNNNNNKLCKSDRNGNPEKGKLKKQSDQKTISRLQAIGMTDDDDDFGKVSFNYYRTTLTDLMSYFHIKNGKCHNIFQ
jgi:hypothetical protein